jgi:hypothetical protein
MGALLRFVSRGSEIGTYFHSSFIRLLLNLKEKLGERDRMAFSIGSPRCYGDAATKLQWQVLLFWDMQKVNAIEGLVFESSSSADAFKGY